MTAVASSVPAVRRRRLNEAAGRKEGDYVLYWMTAARRTRSNFALQHAVELARGLSRPLVVLEALRVGYADASDRLHRFVLQGMADNRARFAKKPATHLAYVEPSPGAGKGLLEALAAQACCVVTDDFPCYFLPRMTAAAAAKLAVAVDAVDGNGLYPMRATERVFTTAHSLRVHLQKELKPHLLELPAEDPFKGVKLPELAALPRGLEKRWPMASDALLEASPAALAALPIDHTVGPAVLQGGSEAGEARMAAFVAQRLKRYEEDRSEPELEGTSGLSPYLHFGHVATHDVFRAVVKQEGWSVDKLGPSNGGSKAGWWKMSAPAEAFLDELITWRELAYNMASHRPDDYFRFDSLPDWAQKTLKAHERDERPHLYSLEALDAARTHDPLWNAAMGQMKRDGWFHNYMRMLWGKKILEWSPSAPEALARMERLMNRYSLDGRNPCSYSGYFWVLGRYDRPWGPERPIFGAIRYMSSDNTAKKFSVKKYVEKYAP